MGSGVHLQPLGLSCCHCPPPYAGRAKGAWLLSSAAPFIQAPAVHHRLSLCITASSCAQPFLCRAPPAVTPQVLVTSNGRVRIGSLGVPEVLTETAGYQDVPQASLRGLCA